MPPRFSTRMSHGDSNLECSKAPRAVTPMTAASSPAIGSSGGQACDLLSRPRARERRGAHEWRIGPSSQLQRPLDSRDAYTLFHVEHSPTVSHAARLQLLAASIPATPGAESDASLLSPT